MQYYIQFNGQSIGPMTKEQLLSYGVTRDTLVSANGGDWCPLYNYPELMEELSRNLGSRSYAAAVPDSRKMVCGILAILIGGLGLQYFLIGKTTAGIINIVLSLVTCGLWSIVNLIQGIMILCMSEDEWRSKYVDSTSTFPVF